MWLRRPSDYRTLLWAALMPAVALAQYLRPEWIAYLFPVGCYLALSAGVIAHNHNHCTTFKSRRLNRWFSLWLSLFYGYPTFAWIPTHNMNHHKYVNRPGDATITWRYRNTHDLFTAVTYFFVSSYWQSEPIKTFIRKAREGNRRLYREILFQYAVWGTAALATASFGVALHGWKRGLWVWACATLFPALFALWTIMLFNYEQHVHADPWSPHNHSRSWSGHLVNFFLFNNGLHAAHHENAGTHWSELREVHDRIKSRIDPRLVEKGLFWYFTKCYLLAPLFPRFGTQQIGTLLPENPASVSLSTADVPLAEAGQTAAIG